MTFDALWRTTAAIAAAVAPPGRQAEAVAQLRTCVQQLAKRNGDEVTENEVTEDEAETRARQVWPEAEGFLPSTRGWTFRVEHGFAYVTKAGVVARDPQGTRFDAVSAMGRRTPPASGATLHQGH